MNNENELIPYQAVHQVGQGPALVLAPHPDDEVLGCAGAILRHVAAGDPVRVIILTDGGGWQADGAEREATVAQRRHESREAAAILGYGEPEFWAYRDRDLRYDEPLVRRLCQAVTTAAAHWIYAPSPYELHPDHRALALVALEAMRRLADPVNLAWYEVGAPLPPNRLLDITDLIESKRRALACFTSQLAAQAYDRHIEALNRFRTYTLPREVEAAEAYRVIEGSATRGKLRMLQTMMADWWRVAEAPTAIPAGPLVSVIIRTTVRVELAEALASLAAQTYSRLDIVLVDARGAGLLLPDSTHYRFPLRVGNAGGALGRSAAANLGLELAQGDLLLFLDDDDWVEPDHIAGLVEQLELDSAAIAAYAGVRCVRRAADGAWETVRIYNDPFDASRLRCENFIPIHALLFRRAALTGAAPCRFDEQFDLYEDWDFWLQLCERGEFRHRDALSACYRIHDQGGMGVAADEQQALAALQTLVAKWRSRWTDRELMDLIARARHLQRLLQEVETQRAEAVQQVNQLTLAVQHQAQTLRLLEAGHEAILQASVTCEQDSKAESTQLLQIQTRPEMRWVELATQRVEITRIDREGYQSVIGLTARTPHLLRLLQEIETQRSEAVQQVDQLALAVQHQAQTLRLLEARHAAILQSSAARERELQAESAQLQTQLEAQRRELAIQCAETARIDQEWRERYAWVMASRSWRLTAPLRDGGRWLREQRTELTRRLWQTGVTLYRGPGGGLLRRLPFAWKQAMRRWLRRGVTTQPAAEPARLAGGPLRVSIIVPVYNHADYLERCLRSALEQSHPEVEVIAVDDASPDPRVRELLDRLADHPRLRVFANPVNLGIAQTQNRALIESQGDLIGFLDCDDYLTPDAVAVCLRHWREGIVYVHSARINVNAQDEEVSRISFEHLPRQDYFAENLERMYATHFKLISREAFSRVGLFDPRFDAAQDYDLLMRIAFHYPSSAFVHVPEFVYYHRFHQGQATALQNDRQQEATTAIQQEARLRQAVRVGRFDRFLSIIMLSFGKQRQTLAALESLQATVRIPHEIILFDNGSESETVAFLRERIDGHFPMVRVIYHPDNLGPAAGRCEALKYARGDWFLVFDNDEIAEPGWLEEALVRASSSPDVGAVCCKVVFPNRRLQFSGGFIRHLDPDLIELGLYDRDQDVAELATMVLRECDWCPIGATLFTVNPGPFLHQGYPNAFEDAGVSMALRRQGLRLLNSPASWVWHEHFLFQEQLEMKDRYLRGRYDPRRMLTSIASFYAETGLIIHDEYVWRENGLFALSRPELKRLLDRQRTVA